ncbi:MAG: prepilin-type cleavage/methylation domain-containing protein [Gammaproteobacteria bacterium]|nr:prepilin-type cleavage/methylation domain-containing protein [Gammaproteobacteria bacterium]
MELVIALVILSVGVTAFLNLIITTTQHSADPMVQQQSHAIAQAYMEEILAQPFCDPDFAIDCRTACTSATACATCNTVEGARNDYDAVCDYAGLSDATGARDFSGALVGGLTAYNVSVAVDDSAVTLSGLSSASGQLVEVTVTVAHDTQTINTALKAFKFNN